MVPEEGFGIKKTIEFGSFAAPPVGWPEAMQVRENWCSLYQPDLSVLAALAAMKQVRIIAFVTSLMLAGPVWLLAAAPLFRVTNLGTLVGDSSGGASVNNLGQVVGGSGWVSGGPSHAFIYSGGAMQFLGSEADSLSKGAERINSHGDAFGRIPFGSAFLFTEGVYYYFNTSDVFLEDFNDRLVYVGSANSLAFIGNLGGSEYILPALGQPAFLNGSANAINNSGKVVGEFWNGPGLTRSPFYYQEGGSAPTLLPVPAGYQSMNPKAINALGAFTGYVNGAQTRAFVCDGVNSPVTILPLIENWTYCDGVDISDDGTVLGYGGTGTGITPAFLYQAGQMYMLADLVNGTGQGWVFDSVASISPNGKYLTGSGRFGTQYRAFLLTAINPEEYIVITKASRNGTNFTLDFASDRGLAGWQIKASTNLNSFPINKTPDSVITEGYPGVYHAVVNIAGAPNAYFLRVERP